MTISDRVRRSLQEFGLTEYEIRSYTSLLEVGPATANQLSEASDVPYSKIYEVLGSLEKKGWIEMEHGRPSKYYPKPPSLAMEITRSQLETSLKTSEALVLDELQPIYEKKGVRERPDIWIVRGDFNVLAKIRETMEHVQKEILASVPTIPDSVAEMLIPIVKSIAERGVKVQLMTMQNPWNETMAKLAKFCEVRVREQMFGGGIIADGREVILLLGQEGEEAISLAIWSDHIGLSKFAKTYFEYLWGDSAPIHNQ
ncbi:MAG TPA: helix-turn-helix domain-containing protein [Candidatus Acidoferrales bacterium]|nr:helix-turn-helix domain-containing protein [Candidatus Acidoferrales bacterium]